MSTALEKQNLRREALARRDALGERERDAKSLRLCRALDTLGELRGARLVLCYCPHGSECDLSLLYASLRERGVTLAFPAAGADGTMEAYVPGAALIRGRFGIPEPDPARSRLVDPAELDAVLIKARQEAGDDMEAYLEKVEELLPGDMSLEDEQVSWTEPLDNRNMKCIVQLLPPGEAQRTKWISHKLLVEEPEEDWEW